jgi:hypothetical protein
LQIHTFTIISINIAKINQQAFILLRQKTHFFA